MAWSMVNVYSGEHIIDRLSRCEPAGLWQPRLGGAGLTGSEGPGRQQYNAGCVCRHLLANTWAWHASVRVVVAFSEVEVKIATNCRCAHVTLQNNPNPRQCIIA